MQSIAQDTIYIEVIAKGIEIGGVKCPVGWKGDIPKVHARALIKKEKIKPASKTEAAAPAPAAEPVAPQSKVVDTASEPDVVPSPKVKEAAKAEAKTKPAAAATKRVPRNGR